MTGLDWMTEVLFLTGSRDIAYNNVQTALRPTHNVLEVKCLGCEADYSPPSSAKVKNLWNCNSAMVLN